MSKIVTKNKVVPFNQQEDKNEEIIFVKIFKGMERFAKFYDTVFQFKYFFEHK